MPRAFVRVDAMPRNAMGKVDKGRLREVVGKDRGEASGKAGGQLVPARLRRASTDRCFCADFLPGGERFGRGLE